jgi:hypothetical protein
VRVAQEIQFERPDFWVAPKRDFGISLLCASRPLIEFVLRHRAETTANIVLRPQCRVTEIVPAKTDEAVRDLPRSSPSFPNRHQSGHPAFSELPGDRHIVSANDSETKLGCAQRSCRPERAVVVANTACIAMHARQARPGYFVMAISNSAEAHGLSEWRPSPGRPDLFTTASSSHQTRCWGKADSNSWSHLWIRVSFGETGRK